MRRRDVLKAALALPLAGVVSGGSESAFGATATRVAALPHARVRPGDPGWPSALEWGRLRSQVGGRLVQPLSPFAGSDESRATALEYIGNPYYIGDEVALTQTSGWMHAWQSQPSAYAVVAESTADVVAAVNFAREHNLRLVVKGGGHGFGGPEINAKVLAFLKKHLKGK